MSTSEEIDKNVEYYKWMIRPCVVYYDEYSECSSMRGRFHQFFIYGETLDCVQWKTDYKNCKKWESDENKSAANDVISSEKTRKAARLKAHHDNDIWTNRDEPPKDWNKPLPDHILEKHSNSLLAIQEKKVIDNEWRFPTIATLTSCTIM